VKPAYDEKCGDLARYFLPHGADRSIQSLAITIQDAVEGWLSDDVTRFLLDNEDCVPCPVCGSRERDLKTGLPTCECQAPYMQCRDAKTKTGEGAQ
jgi:hypothetical protein